jgi:hypothetical protein
MNQIDSMIGLPQGSSDFVSQNKVIFYDQDTHSA